MGYSLKIGVWKTAKNALILLAPSTIAFMANLPMEWQTQYAPIISLIAYFVKNWLENR